MKSILSADEKIVVLCQTIFFFSGTLAAVFLSIYLFKLGGFSTVTLFYLLNYIFLVVAYVLSGFYLKKISSRRLIVISQIIFTLFWTVLFILKDNAIAYLIPLGISYGLGQGFFWSGINLSQYILSNAERRTSFFGILGSWVHASRGIAPLAGGVIIAAATNIHLNGYSAIFLIVLFLNVINAGVSLRLPSHKGVKFSPVHLVTHQRSRVWKRVLLEQFILGLWDVSISNLFSVFLYLMFSSELEIGITNALVNVAAAAGALLAPFFIRSLKKSHLTAGIFSGLGLLFFAYLQNIPGLILVTFCTVFSFQTIGVTLASAYLSGVDSNPEPWQLKYHMLIERDTVLGIARSISFILLWLAFSRYPKETVAPVWLSVITVFPLLLGYLATKSPQIVQRKAGSEIPAEVPSAV